MTTSRAQPVPRWTDLTLAQRDTTTLRQVLDAHARVQLRALLKVPAQVVPARLRPLLAATQRRLKATARHQPQVAMAVVRWPTHNVLISVVSGALAPGADRRQLADWVEELCLLTWLELARVEALQGGALTWQLRSDGPSLRSIGANLLLRAGRAPLPIRIADGVLEVAGARLALGESSAPWPVTSGQLCRPYHEVVDGVVLATTDNNPLSDFEAHPDKDGNTLDLGEHSAAHWCAVLRDCFDLIDAHLPLLGEELRLVARQIIPVGFDAERHLSASYKEAIGSAYLSLHPNLMTMAEAVIHEFQHNKLNAVAYLDPMLHNAFSPLFTSPVRPDPRPLWGVLLAVHAFQPVAALYRAMRAAGHAAAKDPSFQRRFDQVVRKNHDGADTIAQHAQPTVIGAQLVEEMQRIDRSFRDNITT